MHFPLRRGPRGGFAVNDDTLDAVEDDLRMLLITNYGERVIHFDFGADLRRVIFEFQGDELNQIIKDKIINAVSKWMPFLNVINVKVEDSTTNTTIRQNEVVVEIRFTVGNIDISRILVQRIKA
jgi:phage baseplate assembly protein W